jgi:RHH-type transcriptional regulator, proline utilization regulon repressor / proline dehydrogenase / delta 1-pyrroline-5-carboxylate dehydrogenase
VSTILFSALPNHLTAAMARITAAYAVDETQHVAYLLEQAHVPLAQQHFVQTLAIDLVKKVRSLSAEQGVIEAFMREYDLSSEEGLVLMCIAEAFLRIPDSTTADKLIRDKLSGAHWDAHIGKSNSLLVDMSTWGLLFTSKILNLADDNESNIAGIFRRLIVHIGEPSIRLAIRHAMRIMGHQFVLGRTIDEALEYAQKNSQKTTSPNSYYSFDMLGEAALTAADAERYFLAYQNAINAMGARGPYHNIFSAPSISIKLSALHPRYEVSQRLRVMNELAPRVLALAQLAKSVAIGFTIDAEESERLELSLALIANVYADDSLLGWEGFGVAVQAYQKRAPYVLDFLIELAKNSGRRIPVRLVKGAYWDSEIKKAQVEGYSSYPVFTKKMNTDLSYFVCAKKILASVDVLYPMFATHNAQTIAAIYVTAKNIGLPHYEYQRLHGMGRDLYAHVVDKGELVDTDDLAIPCRVYAPVGSHEDLLPYLVRRLLENGANSSFVNRITDENISPEDLVIDPVTACENSASKVHSRIAMPRQLLGDERKNAMGINLHNDSISAELLQSMNAAVKCWQAVPLVPGTKNSGALMAIKNPANHSEIIGEWQSTQVLQVDIALKNADSAFHLWSQTSVALRANCLEVAADLMEKNVAELIALCVKEAGKTIPASVAEVREAIDFCRYYAVQAKKILSHAEKLLGPTGESNELQLRGRGVFVCISPWNFPLAIFVGQVAAALVAGNTVIAKPAEQTNLMAYLAVKLLHEAGVPETVLQLLPGDGAVIGSALTKDARVAGVCFTGSTETAWAINRTLAARNAPIATLIAETGGQNALIADSSALPEQLVKDVMASAFDSAGQRCSAARILFLQNDIADKVITMLCGAMDELVIGDPYLLSTDIGPVIDEDAKAILIAHAERMNKEAILIKALQIPSACKNGSFFAPQVYELKSLSQLSREIFGPVLHVIRYNASQLDDVLHQINASGYGLTLGIHSRIDATVEHILKSVRMGNCYVNRNQIGAVVGVQPFGGQGLSGTGPKAGGPHYLLRFVTESTVTINTTAAGGNSSLLTLGE